jgi:hypothetical protein
LLSLTYPGTSSFLIKKKKNIPCRAFPVLFCSLTFSPSAFLQNSLGEGRGLEVTYSFPGLRFLGGQKPILIGSLAHSRVPVVEEVLEYLLIYRRNPSVS